MGGIFSAIGIILLVLMGYIFIWKFYGFSVNDQSSQKNIFEDDDD